MEKQVETVTRRVGKLKSAQDISRYIARVIRRVERGGEGADPNLNYKLVMMASLLLKAIESGALEKRVARLEAQAEEKSRE